MTFTDRQVSAAAEAIIKFMMRPESDGMPAPVIAIHLARAALEAAAITAGQSEK